MGILNIGIPWVCLMYVCVATNEALRFSCVVSFGATHFLFSRKMRGENKNEREDKGMKRIIVLFLVLSLAIMFCGCARDSVTNAITAECDSFIEKAKQEQSLGNSLYQLENISYKINKISRKSGERYFVDITWYVDASSKDKKESAWTKDLLSCVQYVLVNANITTEDGKSVQITHTNKNFDDSIRIVVNGGAPYSGYDAYKGLVGDSGSSGNSTDSYGHDKSDAIVIAKKTVKNNLKSPSTADFCSTSEATITCDGNTWTVKGWVDAQNSFGATLRSNFTVKFTFTSSDKYTIDSCIIS